MYTRGVLCFTAGWLTKSLLCQTWRGCFGNGQTTLAVRHLHFPTSAKHHLGIKFVFIWLKFTRPSGRKCFRFPSHTHLHWFKHTENLLISVDPLYFSTSLRGISSSNGDVKIPVCDYKYRLFRSVITFTYSVIRFTYAVQCHMNQLPVVLLLMLWLYFLFHQHNHWVLVLMLKYLCFEYSKTNPSC